MHEIHTSSPHVLGASRASPRSSRGGIPTCRLTPPAFAPRATGQLRGRLLAHRPVRRRPRAAQDGHRHQPAAGGVACARRPAASARRAQRPPPAPVRRDVDSVAPPSGRPREARGGEKALACARRRSGSAVRRSSTRTRTGAREREWTEGEGRGQYRRRGRRTQRPGCAGCSRGTAVSESNEGGVGAAVCAVHCGSSRLSSGALPPERFAYY